MVLQFLQDGEKQSVTNVAMYNGIIHRDLDSYISILLDKGMLDVEYKKIKKSTYRYVNISQKGLELLANMEKVMQILGEE